MMKKKQQGLHFLRKSQKEPTRGDKKHTKNEKHTHRYEQKCQSHTPVQGPSTVVCMIVT
jgi:hypothetical protein